MTRIETMTAAHWPRVHEIYAAGIASGNATFQADPPEWADWDAAHLAEHRLVAVDVADPVGSVDPVDPVGSVDLVDPGQVVGWAAVAPTSLRAVYAGVVEHSVYVDPAAAGRGVGRALLAELIASTEQAGIWTLAAGIFPENATSLALHERLGFRRVGIRERIGCHRGVWRDVVLMERRSAVAGCR